MRPRLLSLTGALALLAATGSADQLLLPMNTSPSAAQIGHVFVSTCEPQLRPFMERDFELYKTAFGWEEIETDTEAAFSPADGDLKVTLDTNYAGATCEMTVPAAISGDGSEIYEGLLAHLSTEVKALPEAAAIDGGLRWEWKRGGSSIDVTYSVEFIETSEGHVLRSQSENF